MAIFFGIVTALAFAGMIYWLIRGRRGRGAKPGGTGSGNGFGSGLK